MHVAHAELAAWKILGALDEWLQGGLLQYGAFEIALRHVKLDSLSIPKEDFAIVFTVALYEVNCFWIEGIFSDGYKRHGRTSLAAILPVRSAAWPYPSSSFLILSTAFFQLTCCSTVRPSRASIAAFGALCVFR